MTAPAALLALGAIVSLAASGLPPPPERVVFRTESFGDVVVPHAKHLAARVNCRACHGNGRIEKVAAFGKDRGHAICRGCHAEDDRGPLKCLGCHVLRRGGAGAQPGAQPAATPPPAR